MVEATGSGLLCPSYAGGDDGRVGGPFMHGKKLLRLLRGWSTYDGGMLGHIAESC
jgi:hypothetical protein